LCRHRKKDGSFIDVDISWSIIQFQDREALLTMVHDLTELRRPAEALKKSEARLAAALRIARLGGWEMDLVDLENLDRNPLHWSDETFRIFGLPPGQTPSANGFFFDAVHPEDRPRIQAALAEAFRNREPFEIEHRILLPGGGERVVSGRAEFVVDDSGKPIQLSGIVIDVTERHRPPDFLPASTRAASPPPAERKSEVQRKKSSPKKPRASAAPRRQPKSSKASRKTKPARRTRR
jgi:PAS domain-containing protein